MKNTLVAIVSLALLGSANAFVVTIESSFSQAVVLSDGLTPLPDGGGFVATGFFTGIDDGDLASTAAGDLETAFSQWGSAGQFGFGGFGGVYQVEDGTTPRIAPGDPFVDQAIYTVLGNGASLGESTQLLIYKHGALFQVDNADANPKTYNATLGNSEPGGYLMGMPTGGNVNIGGFDFPAIAMANVIPEPTAAVLGLLGFFGLLRRRR